MRRTSRGSGADAERHRREALEAIERLRQQDVAASRAFDVEGLASLWAEDAVYLAPGEPPVVGAQAIRTQLEALAAQAQDWEVVEYAQEFDDTEVVGELVVEWGSVRGVQRPRGGGPTLRIQVRMMRIWRQQPDGTWRLWRSVFQDAPTTPLPLVDEVVDDAR